MQDNEVGLEQLKNVYKAQTEAYLDFNMALINILTNQKELLGKVESLKILSDDEFKKLSKDYAILEKLFDNFQSAQVKRDAELEEATLEYTAQISDFGGTIEEMKEDVKFIKKMYWDVKNAFNKIAWTIGGIVAFLTILELVTGKVLLDIFK